MNNTLGTNGFRIQTWEYPYGKPPKYTVEFTGTQDDCNFSASVYYVHGWDVKMQNGNPWWTLTATINQEVKNDGLTPISSSASGSYITVNFSLHNANNQKEILHVGSNIISWIDTIATRDKATLSQLIANPPMSGSFGYSSISGDQGINWDFFDPQSPFYLSNSGSIAQCQTVWTMVNNGFKTVPIVETTLRMSAVVPRTNDLSLFNKNINRIYSNTTLNSELGLPSNLYAVLPNNSDPATFVDAGGQPLTLLYGFVKQPPTQTQNGQTITIEQDWIYGLWYQNVFGNRL
jgi:hypothetical protein